MPGASASAFILSVIGISASSPSVVGLRFPFPLLVIVESVPAAVEDGLLRLCDAENSVLPPLGEELRPDHPLLERRRARNDENWRILVYPSL